MIINLNLQNKNVCIVGGGNESLKRIKVLLNEKCKIMVVSDKVNKQISTLAEKKKIQIKKIKLKNAGFLKKENPFIVITTTNNSKLNSDILKQAKKLKIFAYSSDNPEQSDFSNPAAINIEKIIEVAIFTGGKSPVMSKRIKEKVEKTLKKTITNEDIEQIKIQEIARKLIKNRINDQNQRKKFLDLLIRDRKIKQLIKDGKKKVEHHINEMLRDWN